MPKKISNVFILIKTTLIGIQWYFLSLNTQWKLAESAALPLRKNKNVLWSNYFYLKNTFVEKKSFLIFVNFLFDSCRFATNCWRKGVRNQKYKIDYQRLRQMATHQSKQKKTNGTVTSNSKQRLSFFSKWTNSHLNRAIRRIGQNYPGMN